MKPISMILEPYAAGCHLRLGDGDHSSSGEFQDLVEKLQTLGGPLSDVHQISLVDVNDDASNIFIVSSVLAAFDVFCTLILRR